MMIAVPPTYQFGARREPTRRHSGFLLEHHGRFALPACRPRAGCPNFTEAQCAMSRNGRVSRETSNFLRVMKFGTAFEDESGREMHSVHPWPAAGESTVEVALIPESWFSDGKASADTAVRAVPHSAAAPSSGRGSALLPAQHAMTAPARPPRVRGGLGATRVRGEIVDQSAGDQDCDRLSLTHTFAPFSKNGDQCRPVTTGRSHRPPGSDPVSRETGVYVAAAELPGPPPGSPCFT